MSKLFKELVACGRVLDDLCEGPSEGSRCPGCGRWRDLYIVDGYGAHYVCFNEACERCTVVKGVKRKGDSDE